MHTAKPLITLMKDGSLSSTLLSTRALVAQASKLQVPVCPSVSRAKHVPIAKHRLKIPLLMEIIYDLNPPVPQTNGQGSFKHLLRYAAQCWID
jgi:hypothetical protein